jgi:poly-beta-1,6-N-acetyl-D-glucosamine synthase
MIVLVVISVVLVIGYIFFFGKYAFVSRTKLFETNPAVSSVSIIVVVRNEECNIPSLIESLNRQKYSHAAMELLLFDDASVDQTPELLNQLLSPVDFSWKIFSGNELKISGKKAAVSFLTDQAKGLFLLYTDGDVVVPENWITSMVSRFDHPEVQMVCGGVRFSNTRTFFEKLLAVEFAAMIQTSLGAASRHFPFMCNAANMAVRKSALQKISQQKGKSLSSGDDVFLLQSISEKFGNRAIVADFKAPVKTKSPASMNEFLQQRIRWAGKSSKSFWFNSFVVAFLVFAISLWLILLSILSVFKFNALICLLIVFLVKWSVDFWVIKKYRDNFGLFKGGLGMSVILSLVYPWYVVVVALLSLKRTYLWKGRMVN